MAELAIFVGGIHGTGKSFFAARRAIDLGIDHVSASDIIYNQRVISKRVEDINRNQNALVEGFYTLPKGKYILDGHYTLLDRNSDIKRVPINVFSMLRPKKMILLVSDIEKIYRRLIDRDGIEYSLDILKKMNDEEKCYYLELCEYFNIDSDIIYNDFNK